MANEKYLLKILSGPHQGAEVALDEGDLIIGSALDSDLILSDTLVAPHHLKVVVTDTGVSIVPLESPVYFDGQEIAKDAYFAVEPFKFISLGTTHFVIGPIEGEWPALSAADIPNLTKMEKEETQETFGEGEIPGIEETTDRSIEAIEDQKAKQLEQKKRNWIIIGSSIAFLIIIIIATVVFVSSGKEKPLPIDLKKSINEVINSKGLGKNLTVEENNGNYIIKGWVNDYEQRDELEEALHKISPEVVIDIRAGTEAIANVKDLLSGLGASFTFVEGIEPGKVRVYGYHGDDLAWESIKSDIARDIPGLKLLKDEVMTPKKLYATIAKIIDEDKVGDMVQYVPQKEGIILKGMISQGDIPKVKESIMHLQSAVGPGVPIKNQIVVAKPEDLYLDLDIDSVIIGKQGFIITKSGQRLFEGGVLKGGYVIEKISREGIILRKDDKTVTLNLGENYD